MTADVAVPGLDDTVMCQNMMGGPTVIASDPKQTHEVIFQGHNHPDGEDVQPIPEDLMRTPQFRRAIRQGIIRAVSGENNPVIQSALARQSDAFHKRLAADELRAREVLDAPAEDDLIAVICIGPGTREGNTCEEQVPIRAREQGSRPPLCSRHQHLAEMCVKRGSSPWTLESMG